MMMTIVLLLIAALMAAPALAQPTPPVCPLPPYQLPLQSPPRHSFDDADVFSITGGESFPLPDGLRVHHALWSDDGEVAVLLAYSGETDHRVFKVADSELTELLAQDDLMPLRDEDFRNAVRFFNPVFVPGTHTLLTNTEVVFTGPLINVEVPSDLWSLDADTGELTELLPYGEGGSFSVSPDGTRVLLMDTDTIWTTDTDGQNPNVLFEGVVAIGLGHGFDYPDHVWHVDTDGNLSVRVLLFPSHDVNMPGAPVPYEIHEFTLGETLTDRILVTVPSDFFFGVALSPDGGHAAEWKWQNPETGGMADILVDGQPIVSIEVPRGGASLIGWDSPDHIRYGYVDSENNQFEWRIDLCGEITLIESFAEVVSPDGTRAAYIRWRLPGNNDIIVREADGTVRTLFTFGIPPTLVTPSLAWDGNDHLLYTQTAVGGGTVSSEIRRIGLLDNKIEPYAR